ncbi:unnamed protein product, partial [Didymodactylos carnosus]
ALSTNGKEISFDTYYYKEQKHLLTLKYNLLNIFNEYKTNDNKHYLWIIFHLQCNMRFQTDNDVLFSGWSIYMIDDLTNKHETIPYDILIQPSYQYLTVQNQFLLSEQVIDRRLSKFKYNVDNNYNINSRKNTILKCFYDDDNENHHFNLKHIIELKLFDLMKSIPNSKFNDWRYDLIQNMIINVTCRSFNDAYQTLLEQYHDIYLTLLFKHLEQHSFIDSYLTINNVNRMHSLGPLPVSPLSVLSELLFMLL